MSATKNRLQLQRPEKFEIGYLKRITQQFSPKLIIGRGGFGTVYKGKKDDGGFIAVKMLNQTIDQIDDTQFKKEVLNVMHISHPNIVRLEGYCINTDQELITHDGEARFPENQYRLICFEYLPSGSLHAYLNNEDKCRVPNWNERYNIIKGICNGLHYLHDGRGGKYILHLDLKPANVLLDKNMIPKIADFGQSKLRKLNEGQTHTTKLAGTRGYMAPEHIRRGTLVPSKETDVYSLGVIIMEIIAGKRIYPSDQLDEVREKWKETTSREEYEQIEKCIKLALYCMEEEPKKRVDMKQVIEILGISEDDMNHHPDAIEEHCSVVNIHSSEVDPLLEQRHGLLQRCAMPAVQRNSPPKILKSSRTAVTVRTKFWEKMNSEVVPLDTTPSVPLSLSLENHAPLTNTLLERQTPYDEGSKYPDATGVIGLFLVVMVYSVLLLGLWSSITPVSREKSWTMFSIIVDDAYFTRLDLETSSSSSSRMLTYNLSVNMVIYNPSTYIPRVTKAQLEANFFLGGQRFHVVPLVDNNVYLDNTNRVDLGPLSGNVTLDTAGVAEYRKETSTGLYKVELRLAGLVMYSDINTYCNVQATCPTICSVQATCPFKLRLAQPDGRRTEQELISHQKVECPLHMNCSSSNNRG